MKTNEIDRGMWTLFTLAMQFTNPRERFSMWSGPNFGFEVKSLRKQREIGR